MRSPLLLFMLVLSLSMAVTVIGNQRVLLYTAVASDGYRHPSIPDAVKALRQLGEDNNVDMVHCNDRNDFADLDLDQFDALAFISAAGSVLTKKGAANMRKYIARGGGYVGIHEASCAATSVPWYLRLVGAQFTYHPEITHATMNVLVRDHPSTQHLNSTWEVYDEIYNYASDPRKVGATVLLGADESTYWDKIEPSSARAKIQGSPHPIAWYREGDLLTKPSHTRLGGGLDNSKTDIRKGIEGSGGPGRSWYTGLGHTHMCWKQDDFLQHVWGGMSWVLASPSLASSDPSNKDAPGQKHKANSNPMSNASQSASTHQSSAGVHAPPTVQHASTGGSSTANGMFPSALSTIIFAAMACFGSWTLAL